MEGGRGVGGGAGGINNLKGNADDILRDEPEYERLHTADRHTTAALRSPSAQIPHLMFASAGV